MKKNARARISPRNQDLVSEKAHFVTFLFIFQGEALQTVPIPILDRKIRWFLVQTEGKWGFLIHSEHLETHFEMDFDTQNAQKSCFKFS